MINVYKNPHVKEVLLYFLRPKNGQNYFNSNGKLLKSMNYSHYKYYL